MLRTKPDVEIAKVRLSRRWGTARDAVAPRLTDARKTVTPYVETARTKIVKDVVPVVVSAAETAREASGPARAEAKDRATGALAALKGERVKARRWPTAVGFLLLGAAAGTVAAALRPKPQPPTPYPYQREPETEPADQAS